MIFAHFALHLLEAFPPERFAPNRPGLPKLLQGLLVHLLQAAPFYVPFKLLSARRRILLDAVLPEQPVLWRQQVRADRIEMHVITGHADTFVKGKGGALLRPDPTPDPTPSARSVHNHPKGSVDFLLPIARGVSMCPEHSASTVSINCK
jgi:hypothetical protein